MVTIAVTCYSWAPSSGTIYLHVAPSSGRHNSVFSSEMTVIANFFIVLNKIFLANTTFCCVVKVVFVFFSHYHWFHFCRPNLINFVPKFFYKFFYNVFILRLFCIRYRLHFFPITNNFEAVSRRFMLFIFFCKTIYKIWLSVMNVFCEVFKISVN